MSVPEIPPSPTNCQYAGQCKYEPTPKWEKIAAIVGVSAAVIYAAIAFCQWRGQLRAMKVDQRAWVGFSPVKNVVFEREKPFVATLELKNTGKTPAKNLSTKIELRIAPADIAPSVADLDNMLVMPPPAGFLLPGDSYGLNPEFHGRVSGRIPDKEWEELNGGKFTIVIFGKATYTDIFGKDHWTRYCYNSKMTPFLPTPIKFGGCGFYDGIDPEEE